VVPPLKEICPCKLSSLKLIFEVKALKVVFPV
jgi:hypothetical protein